MDTSEILISTFIRDAHYRNEGCPQTNQVRSCQGGDALAQINTRNSGHPRRICPRIHNHNSLPYCPGSLPRELLPTAFRLEAFSYERRRPEKFVNRHEPSAPFRISLHRVGVTWFPIPRRSGGENAAACWYPCWTS